jgi:peptidoglycan/xylan/chitin deacetylase (PgdA/CDA1 family)
MAGVGACVKQKAGENSSMDALHPGQTDESALKKSARIAYHSVRAMYRKVRTLKNRGLNFIDRPVIILLYHRVADLPSDPEGLAVSPDNFRHHMEFLKQQYLIVRFEEDWANVKEPAVAITFDDGYADNFLEALPILENVGVPATFFISTGSVAGTLKEFWWHQLEAILLQDKEFPARFTLQDDLYGRSWETKTRGERNKLYTELKILMQRIHPNQQEDWLEQLQKWAGTSYTKKNAHRTMTPDEVRKLAASPWTTIGAHTITHIALSALNEEQQRKEIFTSKHELENITGKRIIVFSYPFGRKKDYNQTSVRLCREAGFTKAASNFPGQVHTWTDPFQLPRQLVRNWDLDTFTSEIREFWKR